VVILLYLSSKDGFLERIDVVKCLSNFNDAVETGVYGEREIEMKGVILEIANNIFDSDSPVKPEKINNLFRIQSFNMF
jgi:hypothetical protein